MTPLPRLSNTNGYDTQGCLVWLGKPADSDGYRVGYIEPDGLGHESHRAAELSRASGMFLEELRLYVAGFGPRPDPEALCAEWCSPWNVDRAVAQCREDALFWAKMRDMARHDPVHQGMIGSVRPMPCGVDPAAPFVRA